MSLDDRLRADLAEMARTMDMTVEPALEAVLERGEGSDRGERLIHRVLATAAALLLVFGTLAWLFSGREEKPQVTVDPPPPSGTYQAALTSDLAGTWRIRFGASSMSVVAPDNRPLGTRVASAPYDAREACSRRPCFPTVPALDRVPTAGGLATTACGSRSWTTTVRCASD